MRISRFVHGIINPELIKRFQEKIPKTVDEMMQVATSFLQGQEAASNQERKKVPQAWRHQEGGSIGRISKKGERLPQTTYEQTKGRDGLDSSHKNPKDILDIEKRKIQNSNSDDNPVEKRNDMLKAGKLSHIIRELKQKQRKTKPKKKGETSGKEKPRAILMIQSRQKAKKRGQAAEGMYNHDEVSKFVTAGIMREVHYHDWLSNPVMVKKSDNS
ncbi:hypothetical protein Tco_1184192 [Tanacetum coccineum]